MEFMEASRENAEIVNSIIKLLHEKEKSVAQSQAILTFTSGKIARDTRVGELNPLNYEE
jgi:hypothetical protein